MRTLAALFLGTGTALAQSAVPPPQFDRPYVGGRLIVETIATQERLWAICKPGLGLDDSHMWRLRACAMRWSTGDEPRCHVFILPDHLLAAKGTTRASALRHEIGHCNGWQHN